jgi:holo-[acyl-carrier protein] synthase
VSLAGVGGLGLDVVGLSRFERLLARSPDFAERYFTPQERHRCRAAARPSDAFATTFAVKEAWLKALGVGVLDGIALEELDVVLDRHHATIHTAGGAAARQGARVSMAAWARDHERAWAVVVLV